MVIRNIQVNCTWFIIYIGLIILILLGLNYYSADKAVEKELLCTLPCIHRSEEKRNEWELFRMSYCQYYQYLLIDVGGSKLQ